MATNDWITRGTDDDFVTRTSGEEQIQSNARQAEDFLATRGDANSNLDAGVRWAMQYMADKDAGWTTRVPEGYDASGDKKLGASIRHGIESGGVRMTKGLVGIAKMQAEHGTDWRQKFYDTGIGATLKMTAKSIGLDPEEMLQSFDKSLGEWSESMGQGLVQYQKENPHIAMDTDENDGFWATTFDILSSPEKVLQGVVEAIPLMLEAGLGTMIAGPAGGIAVMSQPIAGETYMDARAEGTSPMKALVQAQLTGLGEAAIEQWTFGKKLQLAKGFRNIAKKGGKEMLWEGAKLYGRGMMEEGAQGFNKNVWNWMFTDRSQELTEGVLQAAAIGGPLELIMGGGFAAAGKVANALVGDAAKVKIIDKLRQGINNNPAMAQEFKDELNDEFDRVTKEIAEDKWAEAPAEDDGDFVFDEDGEFVGERDTESILTEEEMADMVLEGAEEGSVIEDLNETQTEPEGAVQKLRQLIDTILIDQIRQTTKIERDQELGTRVHKAEQAEIKARKDGVSIRDARRIAKGMIKGELAKAVFPAFTSEQFSASEWELVRQAVLDKGDSFWAREHSLEAINKLQDGIVPPPNEMDSLAEVIGKEAAQAIVDNSKGLLGKANLFVAEMINLPVTLLASSEVSMIGRQGFTAMTRFPVKWTKALIHSYKAYFNDDWAKQKQKDLLTRKYHDQSTRHLLEMTEMDSAMTKRHERFQSTWAKQLPWIGVLVRASERAAVVGMNSLRAQIYDQFAEDWEGTNKPVSEYIQLARIANASTGRGNITNAKVKAILPWLNVAFFSPRYVWSRFELLAMAGTGTFDVAKGFLTGTEIRATSKIQAQMLVTTVAAGMTAMAIASALGADVEKDPRSSDYGKGKFGRTRFDIWGGFQQIARTMAQMATGQGKSTSGEKEIYTKDRLETFGRFIQSKMSPLGGLAIEMLTGKDFLGEPLPEFKNTDEFLEYAIYKKLTPLIIQDTIDAIRYSESKPGLALAFPAAFHGVGVQTYDRKPIDDLSDMQDFYAKQVFHKPWRELGPDSQKALTEYRPQIAEAAAVAKYERRNATFDLRKQREAGLEIEKALPDGVMDEMDSLNVTVGGLSRTLTRNWRLNKRLYAEYKDTVSGSLNKVLPKVMGNSAYQRQDDAGKQGILKMVIDDVKQAIRQKIVAEANMTDLEDLKKGVEQDG